MTVSESIFAWIENNKYFFKVQAICKKVGIDKGNFSKYKTAKIIPEKYINPILDIITPLGFKKEENLEPEKSKRLPKKDTDNKSYSEYNFVNEQWLILEKYTKFPNSQKPKVWMHQVEWNKQKKESDQKIIVAWSEFKKDINDNII